MLTDANLKELLEYQGEKQVLSVFVNTHSADGDTDAYKLNLRSMLKDVTLAADGEAVENYFNTRYDWSGRGVAVFSSNAGGFLRAYPLAIPLRNQVVVGDKPFVKPLVALLDYYGGYGVALVDKQGARLFSFHLGEVAEQEGILGESVRRTKRGGASAKPGVRGGVAGQTRSEDELTERNFRDTAEFAAQFFKEKNVRRVLLGGTDENVALLRGLLPKSWQSLIVGTFPMSMTASKGEVLQKVMEIGRQAEFRKEEQLLQRLVTNAAKEQSGVLGLEGTLQAVQDGRVQTLVLQEGYWEAGYQCQGCGFVTAAALPACPYCGSAFTRIEDAVEMAVYKVFKAGGEVEILQYTHESSAFKSIGAMLRY